MIDSDNAQPQIEAIDSTQEEEQTTPKYEEQETVIKAVKAKQEALRTKIAKESK